MATVSKNICELIEINFNDKIENFGITVHGGNKKGEGFLGEIIFVSLNNKKTNEQYHVVIKSVVSSDVPATKHYISAAYLNEIYFYSQVLPEMKQFQKQFEKVVPLDIAPKYYGSISTNGDEAIILENLKFKCYEMYPKTIPLTHEIIERMFVIYGQFHALSFAFKQHQPEMFLKLANGLRNNWILFQNADLGIFVINENFKYISTLLKKLPNSNIFEKVAPYIENGREVFKKGVQYNGPYSVIVHGDSWSNNIMIRYNPSKNVEDIKLIDYQYCMLGTPVYDLQYAFYSGASKETIKDWEKFLKIYHNSLRDSLKGYNLNAETIYPYEELKREWKTYSQFAFVMSILACSIKFVDEDHAPSLQVTKDHIFFTKFYNNRHYTEFVVDLVTHFYENDFL